MNEQMTPQEYLSQGYHLRQQIELDLEEIERLRQLSTSVSSICLEDRGHNPNAADDARFVHMLVMIDERKEQVNENLEKLIELQKEIPCVIDAIDDNMLRLVLKYRYMENKSFRQIARLIHVDCRTAKRWHDEALAKIKVPRS